MQGELNLRIVAAVEEKGQQSWQMGKVAGDQNVSRFSANPLTNPRCRVVGLDIAGGGEFREGIARFPERLSRLLRTKLSAVPDQRGADAPGGRLRGQPFDAFTAGCRERPAWIHLGAHCIAVVHEIKVHRVAPVYFE